MRQRREFAHQDQIGSNLIRKESSGPHLRGNQARPLSITTPSIASNLEHPFRRRIALRKAITISMDLETVVLVADSGEEYCCFKGGRLMKNVCERNSAADGGTRWLLKPVD